MFVWCSLAAAFASRSNRRRLAGSRKTVAGSSLSATRRPRETCSAS